MLDYFNSSAQANSVIKDIVNLMVKYKINPTPINYAVVYKYCLILSKPEENKNAGFVASISSVLVHNSVVDDISLLKIYRKYIKYVPETSVEVLDHLYNFPNLINSIVEKFSNYSAYQVSLSYKEIDYLVEKEKILSELYQLEKEVDNIDYLHDRISELVLSGGVDTLQDVFTGLYTDHEIIVDFNYRYKQEEKFYILLITIDGVSEVKNNFGDQMEEALARHFVRLVNPLIPDHIRLYRLISDDAYIVMSYSQEELNVIEDDIKKAFAAKELLHRSTGENLNEMIKIKSSVIQVSKPFKQSIKIAKQQLKS